MRGLPVVVLAALLVPGCGGLLRESRPTVRLALEPALPADGLRAGAPSLEVGSFATDAAFGSDQLSVREGPSRWSHTINHRWVADPGEMVASSARDYLGRTGLFGAIHTAPGPVPADYRLGGAVRRLFWDREQRAAVLEFEASLVTPAGELRGFWIYRRAAPVEGTEIAAFLRAASSALGLALADLNRDLAVAVGGARPTGNR